MKARSRYNPIKYSDIRSLVQVVSVHVMVSEGQGHRDPASLTSFNLIRPMTALSALVSRNTFHPRHQTEGCSLKHTERIGAAQTHTATTLIVYTAFHTVHITSLCELCGGVKGS